MYNLLYKPAFKEQYEKQMATPLQVVDTFEAEKSVTVIRSGSVLVEYAKVFGRTVLCGIENRVETAIDVSTDLASAAHSAGTEVVERFARIIHL